MGTCGAAIAMNAEQISFDSIMFPADRKVLTVAEVAARLDVTEQHVRDLIEEGKIQALDVGGGGNRYWKIPVEGYEKFIADRHSFNI